MLENGIIIGLEDVLDRGFFIGHDVAVDLVDHTLAAVPDKISDVIFRDVEGEHDGYGIVAQVVETVVADTFALQKLLETVGDNIRFDCDICATVLVFLAVVGFIVLLATLLGGFGVQESDGNGREQPNRSGACCGLGALFHELQILREHECFADVDLVLLEINIIPGEGADFRTAHTAQSAQDDRDFHLGAAGDTEEMLHLFLCGNLYLGPLLLREGGMEDEVGAEHLEHRRKDAVDVGHGLGGAGHSLLIDGDLHLLLGDLLHVQRVELGEVISADGTVGLDGGGGEHGALGLNISVEGGTEGEGLLLFFLVPFLLRLEQHQLHDEGVVVGVGEGLVTLLSAGIGVGIN